MTLCYQIPKHAKEKSMRFRKCLVSGLLLVFMFDMTHGATVDLGVNLTRQSLQAEPAGKTENIGKMEGDFSVWPTILIRSNDAFFTDSHWGYSYEFIAGKFNIDKQEVEGEQLDLGTEVEGYYAYLIPMFYYKIGQIDNNERTSWNTTLGLGIGIGYLNLDGDMIMTEVNSNIKKNVSGSGIGMSVGLYIEFDNNDWFIRISNYAPEVEIREFNLMLHNVSMIFGRRIEFDI